MRRLEGQRVLVVGLARSGLAAARFLARRGGRVTVTDLRPPAAFREETRELLDLKVGLELGLHRDETFLAQDLIVVSPGVPWNAAPLEAARRKGVDVIPEVELAGEFLRGRLIGITGTNGKTTTTALAGKMLEASGFPAFVAGNIGVPLISIVEQSNEDSIVVAELSSFQLEAIRDFHAPIAVLLNLSANHLDRHLSLEAYLQAKAQIFRNQMAEDVAILNADDDRVLSLGEATASRKLFFSRRRELPEGVFVSEGQVRYRIEGLERTLMEVNDIRLRGGFNVENVLAAAAAACAVGADCAALRRAVRDFRGVEHRLEFVKEIRGVAFYNDSKATSVDAAMKALSTFSHGVHLILGGKHKGAPYTALRPMMAGRVREVLTIGAASDLIANDLAGAIEIVRAGNLENAVREAFRQAAPGDTILLAPACASFDQFQDFEHRGRAFKELVGQIAREVEAAGRSDLVLEAPPAILDRPQPEHRPLAGVGDSAQVSEIKPGPLAGPQNDSAREGAAARESENSASTVGTEERSPEPLAPLASPCNLEYVYEVSAEEIVHAEDFSSEPPASDFGMAAEVEQRRLEAADDEAMSYEVRDTPASGAGEKTSVVRKG